MKLEIDRRKWLRGEGGEKSYLYREDRKQCCLGIYMEELGFNQEKLLGRHHPYNVCKLEALPNWMMGKVMIELMMINDLEDLEEAERERKLKEKFGMVGIEVEFVEGA